MVEVNLLAWRDKKHVYERKMLTLAMVASVVVAIVLVSILHFIIELQVNDEKRRVQQIQERLPDQTPQKNSGHVMPSSHSPEEYIPGDVLGLSLDDLSSVVGNGICFQRLMRSERGWHLTGKALSLQSILLAKKLLIASSQFKEVIISDVKKDVMDDGFHFVMHEGNADSVSEG